MAHCIRIIIILKHFCVIGHKNWNISIQETTCTHDYNFRIFKKVSFMGSQYRLFLHYYHVLQRQNLYKMNTPVAESA